MPMASKCAVDDEVGEGDGDGDGDGGEGASASHGEGEGDGEDGHDDGDERVGELVPEGDAEAHGVKSALAEVADVVVKLAEVHLLGLEILFGEIAGVFVDFREGGLAELAKGEGFAPFMSRTQPFWKRQAPESVSR